MGFAGAPLILLGDRHVERCCGRLWTCGKSQCQLFVGGMATFRSAGSLGIDCRFKAGRKGRRRPRRWHDQNYGYPASCRY